MGSVRRAERGWRRAAASPCFTCARMCVPAGCESALVTAAAAEGEPCVKAVSLAMVMTATRAACVQRRWAARRQAVAGPPPPAPKGERSTAHSTWPSQRMLRRMHTCYTSLLLSQCLTVPLVPIAGRHLQAQVRGSLAPARADASLLMCIRGVCSSATRSRCLSPLSRSSGCSSSSCLRLQRASSLRWLALASGAQPPTERCCETAHHSHCGYYSAAC